MTRKPKLLQRTPKEGPVKPRPKFSCGFVLSKSQMPKHVRSQAHLDVLSKHVKPELKPVLTQEVADQTEPLPTTTASITELDQLSSNIAEESHQVLAKLDGTSMMQELASASRARDYVNHSESKLCRESGYVEQMRLAETLKNSAKFKPIPKAKAPKC